MFNSQTCKYRLHSKTKPNKNCAILNKRECKLTHEPCEFFEPRHVLDMSKVVIPQYLKQYKKGE